MLERITTSLSSWTERLFVVITYLLMVITALGIVARYGLNQPLSWSDEVSRYLMIWMVMIGISYGVDKGLHPALELVEVRVSRRKRAALKLVQYLCTIVFWVFSGYLGAGLAIRVSSQTSPAVGLNMFWVYVSMPVCAVLSLVYIPSKLVAHYRELSKVE